MSWKYIFFPMAPGKLDDRLVFCICNKTPMFTNSRVVIDGVELINKLLHMQLWDRGSVCMCACVWPPDCLHIMNLPSFGVRVYLLQVIHWLLLPGCHLGGWLGGWSRCSVRSTLWMLSGGLYKEWTKVPHRKGSSYRLVLQSHWVHGREQWN